MIVEFERLVGHPVDVVFSVMADIERRPEWVALAIDRSKLTAGEVSVGTRFKATDHYPARRTEFVHQVTAYEVNRLFGESWDGPLAGQMRTRFVGEEGSSRLIVAIEIELAGVLTLVAPMLKGWLVRALTKDFARLEQLLDAET